MATKTTKLVGIDVYDGKRKKSAQINVIPDDPTLVKIDKLCAKNDWSRAKTSLKLIEAGLASGRVR